MNEVLNQKFIDWNRKGIVPGPEETTEEYAKRAGYCLSLNENLESELSRDVPFWRDKAATNGPLQKAMNKTAEKYDVAPDWVPLFFSNYRMPIWQGGCAWIFQVTEDSPRAALIQLRKGFAKSDRYLKIYDKTELLAHELSHVGRLAYEEPKFEEFLAYRISDSSFRRQFGPIVKSSWESLVFVLTLMAALLLGIVLPALGKPNFSLFPTIVPMGLIIAALTRLWFRHRQLNRCVTKVEGATGCPAKANAVIYRLTDKEIIAFSRSQSGEILRYARDQESRSPRWHVISESYFTRV